MTNGIVYVATGQKYIDQCLVSANSLKQQMPEIGITLFADRQVMDAAISECILIKSPRGGFYDRISLLQKSPYDNTLFLDCDTYVCGRLDEIFTVLEKFDLAVAHAPVREAYNTFTTLADGSPANPEELLAEKPPRAFPEFNCGVIAYRNNGKVASFLKKWLEGFETHAGKYARGWFTSDQVSFRQAVYESNLRLAVLPAEYNCRIIYPVYVFDRVRILHGRCTNYPALERIINASREPRVFLPFLNRLVGHTDLIENAGEVSALLNPPGSAPDLDALFTRHQSDKGSLKHHYGRYYAAHLQQFRNRKINLLEIGVLNGASLRSWREYLPRADIAGLDINPAAASLFADDPRVNIWAGSQTDTSVLAQIQAHFSSGLDVVIDDGSHINTHIIETFCYLFPRLNPGGLYVIEDLRTSYKESLDEIRSWPGMKLNQDLHANDRADLMGFFNRLLQEMDHGESETESINFYRELCFITKKQG